MTNEELFKIKLEKYGGIFLIGSYKNAKTKVTLGCSCGHTWEVIPSNLVSRGNGTKCIKCHPHVQYNKKDSNVFAEELPKDITLISEYVGARVKVTLQCSCGHTWEALPTNITSHDSGIRCIKCNPFSTSKAEIEIREFISSIYRGWVEYKDRKLLPNNLEIDIVIPDKGLAFEYNGLYFHRESSRVHKKYHQFKTDYLMNEYGYQLIHINEDEWLQKQDIVKSRIRNLFGLSTKIHARKCTVREIDYPGSFLEENHIQGKGAPTSINLGLFYYDELVSVMTFSKPKFSKDYDYELVRFCSLLDISVVGGASKLYKYFTTHYKGSIVSYSDRRWSTGNLYKQLGFTYSHTSEPNYKYYRNAVSLTRYQCQKHLLKDKFPNSYREDLTEKEIMQLEGFYPVYDCGNDVWTQKSPL